MPVLYSIEINAPNDRLQVIVREGTKDFHSTIEKILTQGGLKQDMVAPL